MIKNIIYLVLTVLATISCNSLDNNDSKEMLMKNKLIITPTKFILNYSKIYDKKYSHYPLSKLLIEIEFKNGTKHDVVISNGKSYKTGLGYSSGKSNYELEIVRNRKKIIVNSLSKQKITFLLGYPSQTNISAIIKSCPILNDSTYKMELPSRFDTLKNIIIINKINQDLIPIECYFNDTLVDAKDKRYFISNIPNG